MHLTLRAGEKLFLNGAVLRADRKVSLELMNDATFLLEAHVMGVDKATTPLRQLYFVVQMMLMNPLDVAAARTLFDGSLPRMRAVYGDAAVHVVLDQVNRLVDTARYFDALKLLRGVFAIDDAVAATEPKPANGDKAASVPAPMAEPARAAQTAQETSRRSSGGRTALVRAG
jgi:flagellar biosynthesis repressor protein FlbT